MRGVSDQLDDESTYAALSCVSVSRRPPLQAELSPSPTYSSICVWNGAVSFSAIDVRGVLKALDKSKSSLKH
jgi:hypothetical protein